MGEAMRREFPAARSEELVADAQGQLGAAGIRALPVVRPDGGLAGLLIAADIGEAFRLLTARPRPALGAAAGTPQAVEQGPF